MTVDGSVNPFAGGLSDTNFGQLTNSLDRFPNH